MVNTYVLVVFDYVIDFDTSVWKGAKEAGDTFSEEISIETSLLMAWTCDLCWRR